MQDVLIVGAGVIGGSIARELSKYNLDIVVIDKENDVANGTTKANSAIVHAGYDAVEGTLMAKYNALGNAMFDELSKELDFPFIRTGSIVVASSEEERAHIEDLLNRGIENNIPGVKIVEQEELRRIEPKIGKEAVAALLAPTAGIVGPWEMTIALLENAVDNGVKLDLNTEVLDIEKIEGGYKVVTNKRDYKVKCVINASGVYADKVHQMVAEKTFSIIPRRGQYFVLDKTQGELVNHVIFQCPTKLGKGVLVTPTVHGNVLAGPDAEDLSDREDLGTTTERLDFVREHSLKSIPELNFREGIRNFAGLRAQPSTNDFIVGEVEGAKGFINVAGIKSPGLSSAPAIALDVVEIAKEILGNVELNKEFKANRKHHYEFITETAEKKAELIAEDSRYGNMICRCENITEGEIVDAIHRNVGGTTVDGIKKRCRPGMGRCQGGFCGPKIQEILARELGKSLEEIVLDRENSYILTGETKG
ncbi:MAG: NAD(P)/FAD-dependent oxidoreductase [Psychrilyobacter sp.]|nr:NAD(P)/FAD-dependent oxidoreductase [Psychrilyobacter sp.]